MAVLTILESGYRRVHYTGFNLRSCLKFFHNYKELDQSSY